MKRLQLNALALAPRQKAFAQLDQFIHACRYPVVGCWDVFRMSPARALLGASVVIARRVCIYANSKRRKNISVDQIDTRVLPRARLRVLIFFGVGDFFSWEVCMYLCTYVCVCVCVYVCMCVCVCAYVFGYYSCVMKRSSSSGQKIRLPSSSWIW